MLSKTLFYRTTILHVVHLVLGIWEKPPWNLGETQSVSSVGKHSQTLKSARKERFGIGSKSLAEVDVEKYGRGKRRKGQTIDYLKLNDGEEDLDSTPVPPKKIKHIPVRSGPMPHRQSVQKQVTESPVVTTLSTVKSKKSTEEEPAKICKL